ncbi:cytochrome P450 [Pholiota conissans]|uniref:Cytochrome P450 n=1 Tax=Pholiota conissans TaxID=109636 RepID=A0A9P6CYM4_9AGAR|nr:cytochrome P450 [Pholiota conissans]
MASSNVLLVSLLSLCFFFLFRRKSKLPLPPGPKGWPLIGNALDIPAEYEWKTYHRWSQELGTDILHLNVAGTHLIILDTLETAADLMEKRSSIYSNRPILPMVTELMGYGFLLPFMDYGTEWRQGRRLMDELLRPSSMGQFHPHLLNITRRMLNKFLEDPESDAFDTIRHVVGEIVMSIGYGLQVQPHNDPFVSTAKEATHTLSKASIPGAFLVDAFPILKYVPEWAPGAGFKTKAREWKKVALKMVNAPYEAAKANIASGTFNPSFTSVSLEKMNEGMNPDLYTERNIKNVAGTMYSGGSDTSLSTISSCILGLLKRPDVVAKAQEELDRVLQPGHLPDFNDQESLPYVTAIVKEALRWREVAPIAFPHKLKVDDVYKGYRIPAGSMVIANSWAILHDETVYPDPFTFNPDRFIKDGQLDSSVPDPGLACWGYGRRQCPGRHLAYPSMWIMIASMLTVFDIRKAVNSEGIVIEPLDETIFGVVSMPKPFKCAITPRSENSKRLILAYKS